MKLTRIMRALTIRPRRSRRQRPDPSLVLTFGVSLGVATLLRYSVLPWLVVLFD